MKILFYSKLCKHCNKLFQYKENDPDFIPVKKICVDDTTDLPPQITKVPTLVTEELNSPITGKDVFAYFNCLEMFFQKTNNINYWKDKVLKRPMVDHFIPGKEKPMKYQQIEELHNKSKTPNISNYKQKRNL